MPAPLLAFGERSLYIPHDPFEVEVLIAGKIVPQHASIFGTLVTLPSKVGYALRLNNYHQNLAKAELLIDGIPIGIYKLHSKETLTINPSHNLMEDYTNKIIVVRFIPCYPDTQELIEQAELHHLTLTME